MSSITALLIVDMQNDFTASNGSLSCPGATECVRNINRLILNGHYQYVIKSRDWHPPDHQSFKGNGKTNQSWENLWPPHCVADTWGAEFHANLTDDPSHHVISKGMNREVESYSAFGASNADGSLAEDTKLAEMLLAHNVSRIVVCGVAMEYCVRATCLDALTRLQIEVVVVPEASMGISEKEFSAAVDALSGSGVKILDMDGALKLGA